MESVAAEGYYAYCGNKNKIYAIPSNITDSLSYTKQEMMELPEQPDINASYVTAFKVTPSKGETFEAVYNKNRAQYKDYEGWDITRYMVRRCREVSVHFRISLAVWQTFLAQMV